MGPPFLASGGVGGVEIGWLMFLLFGAQNFKVEKFGKFVLEICEVCVPKGLSDRQMDDVVLEMFISKSFG